jgi:hypothetical protein
MLHTLADYFLMHDLCNVVSKQMVLNRFAYFIYPYDIITFDYRMFVKLQIIITVHQNSDKSKEDEKDRQF